MIKYVTEAQLIGEAYHRHFESYWKSKESIMPSQTLYARAREFLASTWIADQAPAVSRAATELRHALRGAETPEISKRLLTVLQDLDMRKVEGPWRDTRTSAGTPDYTVQPLWRDRDTLAREVLESLDAKQKACAEITKKIADARCDPRWTYEAKGIPYTPPPVDAGVGYNLLSSDDRIQVGDQIGRVNLDGNVVWQTVHDNAHGRRVGRATIRRLAKSSVTDPGEGWRLLEASERTVAGDQVGKRRKRDYEVLWFDVSHFSVNKIVGNATIRRRTEAPAKPETPSIDPGEGYRLLTEGERVDDTTDEFLTPSGRWGIFFGWTGVPFHTDSRIIAARRRVNT